jgi:acetone carboxylase gamma subunit
MKQKIFQWNDIEVSRCECGAAFGEHQTPYRERTGVMVTSTFGSRDANGRGASISSRRQGDAV